MPQLLMIVMKNKQCRVDTAKYVVTAPMSVVFMCGALHARDSTSLSIRYVYFPQTSLFPSTASIFPLADGRGNF